MNRDLQRPTTPGQYHIWENADIPWADVPSQLIKPRPTEADYTRSVSHMAECRHTQGRCAPLLIKLRATEADYTRSVSHSGEYIHTQGRHTPC